MYFCAAIDKYITCARDGTFRLWQAGDLEYVKTVNNGSSWITDCLYLPQSRKMVFTTMDRAITYYDITRCVLCAGIMDWMVHERKHRPYQQSDIVRAHSMCCPAVAGAQDRVALHLCGHAYSSSRTCTRPAACHAASSCVYARALHNTKTLCLPCHAGACCSGSYDLIGRVYASGAMGVPLALHVLSGDAGERVVYGDSRGAAVLLLCGSRELPPRDLISTETHKVRAVLHLVVTSRPVATTACPAQQGNVLPGL